VRQRLREADHPVVLRLVAHGAPVRVVAVLLASACVAPCRLQVAPRIRADPHVVPCRRNHQRADARQLLPIRNTASACREVAERRAVPHPPQPWATIGGIAQTGRASTLCRGGRGARAGVAARSARCSHEVSGGPAHSKTASTRIPGRKSGPSRH
jgi:hypothetical protein